MRRAAFREGRNGPEAGEALIEEPAGIDDPRIPPPIADEPLTDRGARILPTEPAEGAADVVALPRALALLRACHWKHPLEGQRRAVIDVGAGRAVDRETEEKHQRLPGLLCYGMGSIKVCAG